MAAIFGNAIKRAKDLTEITRLNSLISDEQKLLNSFYIQIGMKYFELYGDTDDENFADLCKCIKESKSKIEKYQNEIQVIRNVKICPNCGAECSGSSQFCGSCGTSIIEVRTTQNKITHCSKCGKELPPDAVFCTECGQKAQ